MDFPDFPDSPCLTPLLPGPVDLLWAEAALWLIAAVGHVDRVHKAGALPSPSDSGKDQHQPPEHGAPYAPWRRKAWLVLFAQIQPGEEQTKVTKTII
jgi:hypothetical protein